MRMFSMYICVCLDTNENVFHVYLRVFRQEGECFPCAFVCVLDNDENVSHVHLCVFRQR